MREISQQAPRPSARGNNLEEVRRNNLGTVLTMVHTGGAVARSEITRRTGLNRSTVGALVAELSALGLVVESEPTAIKQVGRPSQLVSPSAHTVALTVYPDLDSVTIGLVALGGQVVKRVRYETTGIPSTKEVVNIVTAVVAGMRTELDAHYNTVGIGLIVPGLVRSRDGQITLAPHLEWHHEPLAEMLEEALGWPVFASNDASAAAVGESLFGAGVGVSDLVLIGGGTSGIGGGIISNGVLLSGTTGYAGEMGHMLVNTAGSLCSCGAYGCLETEVRLEPLLEAVGLRIDQISLLEDSLDEQLNGNDSEALMHLVHQQQDFLAIALRNVVNMFNPERIILAGFLGNLFELAPERLADAVTGSAMSGPREVVTLHKSTPHKDILLVGAAQLVLQHVLANPASSRTQLRSAV